MANEFDRYLTENNYEFGTAELEGLTLGKLCITFSASLTANKITRDW